MKKLILIILLAAFMSCSKDEPEISEKEAENYLSETKWQQYMPIGSSDFMVKKYLIFKKDGTCEHVDSVSNPVTVKKYYYDPISGEPFNNAYYTNLYLNEAKTNIYENLIVQKTLDKLHYYLVMGDMASVINYRKIQ